MKNYPALDVGNIAVGQVLAERAILVSFTGIVASSIAARDFHPLHHDRDFARHQGHPTIFPSSLISGAMAQRFVTDWAGPLARVISMNTRLGVPQYAEDTLVLKGQVTAVPSESSNCIEVTVIGTNSRGQHLQSVIRLDPETQGSGTARSTRGP